MKSAFACALLGFLLMPRVPLSAAESVAASPRKTAAVWADAERFYNQGRKKYEQDDPAGALADFRQAVALRPDFSDAYLYIGWALRDLNNLPGALDAFNRVVALAPSDPESYRARSVARVELQDCEGAIADSRRVLELDPTYGRAHMVIGNAYRVLNRPLDALREYELAIKWDPNFFNGHRNRGIALMDLKRPAEAVEEFDIAIKLGPQYSVGYFLRGQARASLGNHAGAIADFDRALAIEPDLEDAYYHRGNSRLAKGDVKGAEADFVKFSKFRKSKVVLEDPGLVTPSPADIDAAIADYTRIIAQFPANEEAYYSRGLAYYRKRDYQTALPDLQKAVTLTIGSAVPYHQANLVLGMCLSRMGRHDEALSSLNQVLGHAPDNPLALFERARARVGRGELAGALNDYDQVILLAPDNAAALEQRGDLRTRRGNYADAIADYDKAKAFGRREPLALKQAHLLLWGCGDRTMVFDRLAEISPTGPFANLAQEYRGLAYWHSGRLPQALAIFTDQTRRDPNSAQAFYHLALVLENQGEFKAALANYQQAMARCKPAANQGLNPEGNTAADQAEIAAGFEPVGPLRRDLLTSLENRDEERRLAIHTALTLARLGRGDLKTLRRLAERWPECPSRTIGRFLDGAISETEFLAVNDVPRAEKVCCDRYYYAGMRHLLAGETKEARALFIKASSSTLTTSAERRLAKAELDRMD